jgi:hypothetical protein
MYWKSRRGLALPVENLGENSKDSSKALSVETGMFSEEAMLSVRKGAKGMPSVEKRLP